MSIKNRLKIIIKERLEELHIKEDNIIIDIPKLKDNGDYSSNIALILAKRLETNPLDLAKKIAEGISDDFISNIKVAGPGFINFELSKSNITKEINEIIEKGSNYGKNEYGHNKRINVEFVSANPTGNLHIGHGRGAAYGDNLSRILSFCGYNVTREYYINDAGNQMNNLGISIKERYKELCGKECNLPADGYHGQEIITIAEEIKKNFDDSKLEEEISFFKKQGLDVLLKKIKYDLDRYRVNFDVYTSEQSLYDKGLVEKTLINLKKSNKCYINDGALWLKTSDYGDEKDRVLIKNDGNYTYFLPDIAYHENKLDRGFEELIDVLGADHHGYINRLKASLEILNHDPNKLDVKILQMVRLIKDGEELKLSKRTGKTITLTDLMDDIGVNATRFFFASKSLDTQMDFDLDMALKQSNENPVYYVEYANARITSIINKYPSTDSKIEIYDRINKESEYNILKKLCEFEDILVSAARKKAPHIVAAYAYELASLFHSYYSIEKIITDDKDETIQKINFLRAIKIVLNNALDLIGIIPREQM